MSDDEISRQKNTAESVVIVNPTAGSRVETYRPTSLEDPTSDQQHKRVQAPVAHLSSESKDLSKLSKQYVSKVLSSSHDPQQLKQSQTFLLETIQPETIKVIPPAIAPVELKPKTSAASVSNKAEEHQDDDSITEEIEDIPAIETSKVSEWSDEQEASGLPRTESRSSRVSRAVRQLFCCSVAYSPASEEDISTCRMPSGI